MMPRPYCVFYGTRTALVWAPNKTAAYESFVAALRPDTTGNAPDWVRAQGRIIPPTRQECTIRRLRPEDRGWIEEFPEREAAPFLRALEAADA